MKIFISNSSKDRQIIDKLKTVLSDEGHEVISAIDLDVGEVWIEKLNNILRDVDLLVAIVTDNFIQSSFAQAEVSAAVFGIRVPVIPIVVGEITVPFSLMGYQYVSVNNIEGVPEAVLNALKHLDIQTLDENHSKQNEKDNEEKKIAALRKALFDNQLTLVCGAGISKNSDIPLWNNLLANILNEYFTSQNNFDDTKASAETLINKMTQSNLILGKYLKLLLDKNFEKVVQKQLYANFDKNKSLKTDQMKAIVELSRPKRTGKRLESIITFNFDDLIEQTLSLHRIEYCSIWSEGQIHDVDALPIYHVHGFLPHEKEIENPNLVFSEESYHSQFIDPYSWNNLIQLNAFHSNVCLFVGTSLSDPNLRRLLDISWRRNQQCKHYIIIKRPDSKDQTDNLITMITERDANSLGLNVIWCTNFNEIPEILNQIAK